MHVLDHAEDRVVRVAAGFLGLGQLGLSVDHRHGRERHGGQEHVDHGHRAHHERDPARDRLLVVARLLGHVGDRLDPGVGHHRHGDGDEEVADRGHGPEVHLAHQLIGIEHEHDAHDHEQHLGAEVRHREAHVDPRRLLDAHHVQDPEQDHHHDAAHDVGGRFAERRPEDPQVVGHEEGRDRDRDDVGEHLAPRGEEGPELVEGPAGERRGAAGLREHGRGLGVGGGGGGEDQSRDQEHHRRHAEGVDRHQAERVVDRAADVPVGRGEQRAGAQHPLQAAVLGSVLGHGPAEKLAAGDGQLSKPAPTRSSSLSQGPRRPPRSSELTRARRVAWTTA